MSASVVIGPKISVVVCTHNPRRDLLLRVIDHLRLQTLALDEWELLVVDNASADPVESWCDLSWHPNGGIVREDKLGLTHARLCGIASTRGRILVFVDDDNLLAENYLVVADDIGRGFSQLGAWGGAIVPEYQAKPDAAIGPYYKYLALREVEVDRWGNAFEMESTPYGAGLVIRREVAERYADKTRRDPRRQRLDRYGTSLISCGDVDMAWTSIDMGLGTGVFSRLRLNHVIPASRMSLQYIVKIVESITASHRLLDGIRNRSLSPPLGLYGRIRSEMRLWRLQPVERMFARAVIRGQILGFQLLNELSVSATAESPERL